MRSIRRTLRGQSVISKTQWNRAVLLRTRFTELRRSEIYINLKIDADALNRRWRRFCVRRTVYHIYQGQWRQYAGKCTCRYEVHIKIYLFIGHAPVISSLLQWNIFFAVSQQISVSCKRDVVSNASRTQFLRYNLPYASVSFASLRTSLSRSCQLKCNYMWK
jgi:hypothetical protein